MGRWTATGTGGRVGARAGRPKDGPRDAPLVRTPGCLGFGSPGVGLCASSLCLSCADLGLGCTSTKLLNGLLLPHGLDSGQLQWGDPGALEEHQSLGPEGLFRRRPSTSFEDLSEAVVRPRIGGVDPSGALERLPSLSLQPRCTSPFTELQPSFEIVLGEFTGPGLVGRETRRSRLDALDPARGDRNPPRAHLHGHRAGVSFDDDSVNTSTVSEDDLVGRAHPGNQ